MSLGATRSSLLDDIYLDYIQKVFVPSPYLETYLHICVDFCYLSLLCDLVGTIGQHENDSYFRCLTRFSDRRATQEIKYLEPQQVVYDESTGF